MKKRTATLAEYFGVICALIAAGGLHFYYWNFYTSEARSEIVKKEKEIKALREQAKKLAKQKEAAEKQADMYVKQIRAREAELEQYGDFLPSVRTKPLVIKEILSLIEDLGIKILKIQNSPMQRTEGAFTFNFSLKLEGPYKSFKLFLAKIYKSERIFRIKQFQIGSYDNPRHNMEVFVEFQTYFATN